MSSDDSDEPLSALVTKKNDQPKFDGCTEDEASKSEDEEEKKSNVIKKAPLPVKRAKIFPPTQLTERPMDVWLYFKDLTVTGPYSCLLCPEWFINKIKIVIHYILNHKKDFCGICRYFVQDQKHWVLHQQFHCPWVCSQCPETFPSEPDLRVHFSLIHNLVHCRLCSFMVTDDEAYDTHLFKKHNILEITNKDVDFPWEIEYEGGTKFICLFCSRKVLQTDFFRHFMCFHRYTLKCFSMMLSGSEIPFTVHGANISAEFLNSHIGNPLHCGYVDILPKQDEPKIVLQEDTANFIDALIPEIKQEVVPNEVQEDNDKNPSDEEEEAPQEILTDEQKFNNIMAYQGEVIFDITAMEVVVLQDMCRVYVNSVIKEVSEESLQRQMELDFSLLRNVTEKPIACPVCDENLFNISQFSMHIMKVHSVRVVPVYCCRLCLKRFDTEPEYKRHIELEMKDFEDLWLCQFCDREYQNRQDTRDHMREDHLEDLAFDNCISPHLSFQCRYCPYLFWNETEREEHTRMLHPGDRPEEFYKCFLCNVFYSDKVFFIYHFLQMHPDQSKGLVYVLKCMKCFNTTPSIEMMREHFSHSHPDVKRLFCCLPPCKYKAMGHQPKSFRMHKKMIHGRDLCRKGPSPTLSCPVCGREFSNAKACGTHMSLAHGPGRYKCKLCNDVLQSCDERKLHYMIKHPGQHHFECKICKKTFQYKSSLYIHRTNVHFKTQDLFTCKYCKKEFRKRDSYREHLQIHEGPRHTCSYCPMRFVQRSNMLRHERRHTGERPYSCPMCPRTFSDKGACNSHAKTHNRTTSVNQCMYCGQTFVQKSKLKYHIRKHTGEGLETCTICSKIFTSTYYLKEHMKTHEGKPRIPCPICQKTFTERSNIVKHVRRVHSTMGQQDCPLCKKTLTTLAGLRKHLFTHSRVKPFSCLRCNSKYAVKKSIIKHLWKRHKIQKNVDKYYSALEPKDCGIGLDESLLAAIFANPKTLMRTSEDKFDDFPRSDVQIKQENASDYENGDEENSAEGGSTGEESQEADGSQEASDANGSNGPEDELQPPTFVSVKLEPMDSQEYDSEEA